MALDTSQLPTLVPPGAVPGAPNPQAVQAASDRAAISGAVSQAWANQKQLGGAILDAGMLPARAVAGVVNTALRVPNAFGAGIPNIPGAAYGLGSAGPTPYEDGLSQNTTSAPPVADAANTQAPASAVASPTVPSVMAGTGAPASPFASAPAFSTFGGTNAATQPTTVAGGPTNAPVPASPVQTALPAGLPQLAVGGGGGGAVAGQGSGVKVIRGDDMGDATGALAGFGLQSSRAQGYISQGLNYINQGTDEFDRASRGRTIAALLNATVGPNNAGQVYGQNADQIVAADSAANVANIQGATARADTAATEAGALSRAEMQRDTAFATPVIAGQKPVIGPDLSTHMANTYAIRDANAPGGFRPLDGTGMPGARPVLNIGDTYPHDGVVKDNLGRTVTVVNGKVTSIK